MNSSGEASSKDIAEKAEFLDYRIQKLAEGFPKTEFAQGKGVLKGFHQLRASQVRMFPHISSVSSVETMSQRPASAKMLTSLAITSVEQAEDIISSAGPAGVSRLWRPMIDLLLMGSVSCMFLAACHKPLEYGPICAHAFHRGIGLLQQSPYPLSNSRTRMWCSLDELQSIGERIHLHCPGRTSPDLCGTSEAAASAGTLSSQHTFGHNDLFSTLSTLNQDFLMDLGDLDPEWQDQLGELGFMQR
ncbi:hypothetical protein MPH_06556 [Macrophomina phaseolina MS6]|uniref:Uncharacterized protein n=1 Tax=Macrophomina phaseolina (strain MS6) TaxID=1126212 RepID=K2RNF1_MACPH|nr:hypothetical protein MPH_06556 [Macrophomina phaseolina MS6]